MTDEELENILINETAVFLAKLRTTGEDVTFEDLWTKVHVSATKDQFQGVFDGIIFWMRDRGYVTFSDAYDGLNGEIVFATCRFTEKGFDRFSTVVDPDGKRQPPQPAPSIFMQNVKIENSNLQQAGSNSNLSIHQTIDQSEFSQTLNQIEEAIQTLPLEDAERDKAKSFLSALRQYAGKALDATGRLVASTLSALLTAAGSTLGKSLLAVCGMPVL